MHGIVLTQTDDLARFISDLRSNSIRLAKVVTQWGYAWTPDTIAQIVSGVDTLIVRTVSGDGCRPPPDGQNAIFCEPSTVLAELGPWLDVRGDLYCELGNEPNMWDSSTDAAWTFNYWFAQTSAQLRERYPHVRIVSPGLTADGQQAWWDICRESFTFADAIGFHAYAWHEFTQTDTAQLQTALAQLQQFYPGYTSIGTEIGINDAQTPAETKADRYYQTHKTLPTSVMGLLYYHNTDHPSDYDQQCYQFPSSAWPRLRAGEDSMGVPIDTTSYVSPNYDDRPAGTTISSIVVHTTEGAWDGDARWMCNPQPDNPDARVSTHYVISPDGGIFQLVAPQFRAWHAGTSSYAGKSYYNNFSIGVELSHQQGHGYGERQLPAITDLCRELLKRYPSITRTYVVTHRQIAPDRKSDPTDVSDAGFAAWADDLFIPASANYRFRFDQAVFTDRRADAPLALGPDDGASVFHAGDVVHIGDITDGWAWINTGIGFVPMSVISPA